MLGVAAPGPGDAPGQGTLAAFLVPGDRILKLDKGTWHAGPYFAAASALFHNLELADTNVADHQSCDLGEAWGLEFELGGDDSAVDGTTRAT